MKKWSLLIVLLCGIIISGCTTHREDYVKKYKEVLYFTLGDWEVTYKDKLFYKDRKFGIKTYYYMWTIDYEDIKGETYTINIDNGVFRMFNSLESHLQERVKASIKKAIPELDDDEIVIALSGLWLNEDKTEAYDQNLELFYDNFKDVYNFYDFAPNRVFENSPASLSIYLYYTGENAMTNEEKIEKVQMIEDKLLNFIPNINLRFKAYIDREETIENYYISGEQVESNGFYQQLNEKFPQFDILELTSK